MLTAKNIYKRYGTVEVLRGVDVTIHKGEIVSIVGPSGSGKSTLLHILGTLDKQDIGEVYLNDQNISHLHGDKLSSFRNRHIGFIFQFHHLLPEFSALENVCIPGWLSNKNKSDVKKRANELLEILGLSHRIDNKPNQLSGGEQQRVAVARALINQPDIVFADEPTGNLDTANATELHNLFFELRKQFNQTFLIVTHNEELAQLSDRELHMKDGKILEPGFGQNKILCLLSRYAVILWVPLLVALIFFFESKKKAVTITAATIAGILLLFFIPFVFPNPEQLINGFKYYTACALAEWRGQSWETPGELPHQLARAHGFALFYEFERGSVEDKLNSLQNFHLLLSIILPFIMGLWYFKKRRNLLPLHWFLLLTLKIYLSVFFAFIQVPYAYLFFTPLVLSACVLSLYYCSYDLGLRRESIN